jgi:hypothetical protein
MHHTLWATPVLQFGSHRWKSESFTSGTLSCARGYFSDSHKSKLDIARLLRPKSTQFFDPEAQGYMVVKRSSCLIFLFFVARLFCRVASYVLTFLIQLYQH